MRAADVVVDMAAWERGRCVCRERSRHLNGCTALDAVRFPHAVPVSFHL